MMITELKLKEKLQLYWKIRCELIWVSLNEINMSNEKDNSLWGQKGATLSNKTAQKEFNLKPTEIIEAIKSGKLQYRHNNLYGNPCFKLLRSEVENFVIEQYGSDYLNTQKHQAELSKINTEIRSLKRKISELEKRKQAFLVTLNS